MAHVPTADAATLTPFSTINEAKVQGCDGETAGTIAEVMIEAGSGRIAYVALSVGGVFGVGERLIAVPWSCFVVDPLGGVLRLQCDTAKLAELPGFDKDAWPTEADPALA